MDKETLRANYLGVVERASAAALRAGRTTDSWRLVSVTKTVSSAVAQALVELGAADLGENRVQELSAKKTALSRPDVNWHLIGHLQRNKVKKVVGEVALIHSVDSQRLAREIERVAAAENLSQQVLLEVNVADEESKFGLAPQEAPALASLIADMPHVELVGLMTMAPIVSHAEKTRPFFACLRELAERIAAMELFARTDFELSMGMTQDFEVAIEEGATLIRVGSALFKGI